MTILVLKVYFLVHFNPWTIKVAILVLKLFFSAHHLFSLAWFLNTNTTASEGGQSPVRTVGLAEAGRLDIRGWHSWVQWPQVANTVIVHTWLPTTSKAARGHDNNGWQIAGCSGLLWHRATLSCNTSSIYFRSQMEIWCATYWTTL